MDVHTVKHHHEYNQQCQHTEMIEDTVPINFYARTLSDLNE